MRAVTIVFTLIYLLLVVPVYGQAGSPKFLMEPLTVAVDLNAVEVSGGFIVAAEGSGQVVVWREGRISILPVASSDLLESRAAGWCASRLVRAVW